MRTRQRNMSQENNRILSAFDWFLLIGVIVSNIAYSVIFFTRSLDVAAPLARQIIDFAISSLASIAGVFCVVLVAKGSITNYLFGLVNVALYAYISYKARIYGDAGLNLLYYLPMQFIGWWQWRKRGAATSRAEAAASEDKDLQVKARRLTNPQRILLTVGCAAIIAVATYVLHVVNDPQPLKDATTTVLSIVAQFLMSLAIMEQWVLWLIVDAVSVAMWIILTIRGEANAGLMVVMWVFYLANAANGLRVWLRLSRPRNETPRDVVSTP